MAGVEILSQTPIMADKVTLTVILVVFIIYFIISLILTLYSGATDFVPITPIISLLITALILKPYSDITTYETGRYEYKVTIDDSVSMVEFLEKYEIISQEGKIYTIRDVEVQDD